MFVVLPWLRMHCTVDWLFKSLWFIYLLTWWPCSYYYCDRYLRLVTLVTVFHSDVLTIVCILYAIVPISILLVAILTIQVTLDSCCPNCLSLPGTLIYYDDVADVTWCYSLLLCLPDYEPLFSDRTFLILFDDYRRSDFDYGVSVLPLATAIACWYSRYSASHSDALHNSTVLRLYHYCCYYLTSWYSYLYSLLSTVIPVDCSVPFYLYNYAVIWWLKWYWWCILYWLKWPMQSDQYRLTDLTTLPYCDAWFCRLWQMLFENIVMTTDVLTWFFCAVVTVPIQPY